MRPQRVATPRIRDSRAFQRAARCPRCDALSHRNVDVFDARNVVDHGASSVRRGRWTRGKMKEICPAIKIFY
jgi:hypothetical protein